MPDSAFAPLLERTITIAAPPAAVWEAVGDVRRMPEWSPQVVSVRLRAPEDDIRLGSRFTNLNRLGELEWVTHGEIVRHEPERDLAFRIAENYVVWSFALTPDDDHTVLTQRRETPDGISRFSLDLTESHLGGQEAFTALMLDGMEQTLAGIRSSAEAATGR
ncbi:SRPBCC family protein [Tsukamurella ocularis]|uniref:SRPBCC family protein n=1 Tax=Tsukamurella ocularis TaxID=1970234 RepID=UPI0039EE3A34